MGYYDIDTDEAGKQLTPPRLRGLKFLAWIRVLLAPFKYAHNDFFNEYCEYTLPFYGAWSNASTYNVGERIYWTNYKGYVSLKNGNLNIEPTGNAQSEDYWLEFTPDYVAVDDRAYYKPQTILFLEALNAHFKPGPLRIYLSGSTLYYPLFYYDLLGATNTERTRAVLDYANRFMPAGIDEFTVVTY